MTTLRKSQKILNGLTIDPLRPCVQQQREEETEPHMKTTNMIKAILLLSLMQTEVPKRAGI